MSTVLTAVPVLRAEILRWRHSTPQRLAMAPAAFAVVVLVMMLMSAPVTSWQQAMAWDNVWAVAAGPVFAALLGTTIARDDVLTRRGGTVWIPVRPAAARSSRVLLLAAHLLVGNALALAAPAVAGCLNGLAEAPVGRQGALVVMCTVTGMPVALLGQAVTRASSSGVGALAGAGLALSWMAMRSVEGRWWMVWPGNWIVRPTIPLTGTHANGTALPAGNSLWHLSVLAPSLLCLALTMVLAWLPDAASSGRPRRRRLANTILPAQRPLVSRTIRVRPQPARALWLATRRLQGLWLAPVGMALPLCLVRWRPAPQAAMALMVVAVPVVSSVVPIIIWGGIAPAWRLVASSRHGVRRPARCLTSIAALVAVGSGIVALVALVALGLSPRVAGRLAVNTVLVGTLLAVTSSWLTLRFGRAAATTLAAFGTLFATLVGATGLMATLWPVTPWAWGVLSSPWQQALAGAVTTGIVTLVVAALPRTSMRLTTTGA